MIIFFTFIFAFGIPLQAIINPNITAFSVETLLQILNDAYWPVYGEMKVLEKLNLNKCSEDYSWRECFSDVTNISKTSSIFLLMVYMIIASVLLLNLLIAMFR